MKIRYCSPNPDYDYYGKNKFHIKSLRMYDTEESARAVADKYGMNVFHCEYNDCWHVCR